MRPRTWWIGLGLSLAVLGASVVTRARADDPAVASEATRKAMEEEIAWRNRRPHVTLVLVGMQRGAIRPCGCRKPPLGGLERLAALVERLRQRTTAPEGFAGLSLGWTLAGRGEEQEETKATLYRAVLAELGFVSLVLGTSDLYVPAMVQPFETGEGPSPTAGLDAPTPPLNVRLSQASPAFATPPFADVVVRGLPVRALGLVEPELAQRLVVEGLAVGFTGTSAALEGVRPHPDALWIVGANLSGTGFQELTSGLRRLGPAVVVDMTRETGVQRVEGVRLGEEPLVVALDDLGTSVGVLDLDPAPAESGGGWIASYRMVRLAEGMDRWASPLRDRVRDDYMKRYRREVRERGFLRGFRNTFGDPNGLRYVGSAACAPCHPGIYEDWVNSRHALALHTLRELDEHYDPECVRCHVVGFERMDDGKWIRTASAFVDPERTQHLGGVGCENCHGPGSGHLEAPEDRTLWEPGRPNRRHPGLEGCAECHDEENASDFAAAYERVALPKVDHRGVPSDRRTVPHPGRKPPGAPR